MATACRGGLPDLISVRMLWETVLSDPPGFSGMVLTLRERRRLTTLRLSLTFQRTTRQQFALWEPIETILHQLEACSQKKYIVEDFHPG